MTKQEAIIIMGYTGATTVPFSWFHEDVEKRMGRPILTHEFASKGVMDQIHFLYKDDFLAMCEAVEND